jgi:predicted transglutaminase-like cysteine proteinase
VTFPIVFQILRRISRARQALVICCSLTLVSASVTAASGLFGYQENQRTNLELFPQWLSVLERNIAQYAPEGNCESSRLDQCHVKAWQSFLKRIQALPKMEQLNAVNQFANEHEYILDIENYGIDDYWATPKEFLYNDGDCEDYAIIKMLSLKKLGFDMEKIRLVVLQDTNLRIPHAVLAVESPNDTLIMDNQVDEVISHKYILHYVPVYAVNEMKWWMFLPQ